MSSHNGRAYTLRAVSPFIALSAGDATKLIRGGTIEFDRDVGLRVACVHINHGQEQTHSGKSQWESLHSGHGYRTLRHFGLLQKCNASAVFGSQSASPKRVAQNAKPPMQQQSET